MFKVTDSSSFNCFLTQKNSFDLCPSNSVGFLDCYSVPYSAVDSFTSSLKNRPTWCMKQMTKASHVGRHTAPKIMRYYYLQYLFITITTLYTACTKSKANDLVAFAIMKTVLVVSRLCKSWENQILISRHTDYSLHRIIKNQTLVTGYLVPYSGDIRHAPCSEIRWCIMFLNITAQLQARFSYDFQWPLLSNNSKSLSYCQKIYLAQNKYFFAIKNLCCTLSAYTEITNYCCRLLINLDFCFKAHALGVCLMQKHRLQDVYATVYGIVNQLLINLVPFIIDALLKFVNTGNLASINPVLHDPPGARFTKYLTTILG